jgi:outer membrane receptor protein involved in Fe transport
VASSITKAALRGATCLTVLAAFTSTSAFAQDADTTTAATAPADEAAADTSAIVVTGSRIRVPNLESANPVAVLTGEQVFTRGDLNVGDQLNDLPQLRSTFGQQNSTVNLGTRGINLLDLRGLGTSRTLVLVNGRRHVGSDVLVNAVSPDINTIPVDLIERTEILTGGASAVYGSDAIAGVVNFVLKQDFEGVQVRGQTGVSKYGDAGKQYISALVGQNFADGRGNVAVNVEYSHSAPYYAYSRPGLRNNRGFVVTDTDPAGSVNGSDGVSDRTFYNDIRSATIGLGGQVAIYPSAAQRPCGFNVSAFSCSYQFQPDGSLIPQTGQRIGIGPNGNFLGGNGTSSRESQLLTLAPDLERISVNLIGHFEVSPAFVPFIEAKYNRTKAFGSQSGPFFSQGTTLGDPGGRERVRLDNPYLSAQARSVLVPNLAATTVNANTGAVFQDILNDDGTVRTSAAAQLASQRAGIAAGTFRFGLRRNWLDLGIRDEDIKRETYRIVGGVRGDFNDDWSYELSVNYGEHKEKNVIRGNVNVQRYLLSLDSARDASGNIVCRSQLNPAATVSYLTGGTLADGDDPRLAGDISSCVPINPFGSGNVSQAARDYILVDSLATGKITQFDVSGFVTGDSSQLFELPGGPIRFSVGGEYRRETVRYDLDDLTQEGYAFYNAIPSFNAPAFEVKEAYGEIQFPLLAERPFFEQLSLKANGRVSDYKGSTGTVYAYGGEAVWSPVKDLTFRGTYSRSVRAPNLTELYSAQGQNFAPGFVDPCSARNLATGSANRAANCAAAGAPAGYDFAYVSSLEIVSGGNPALREEKSDSYTFGTIVQPRWVPGLSISVDYYKITVDNVISSVEAQDIANLCYDSPSLNNQFCGLFTRAGATGGPAGEVPFQILEGTLLQSSANFAKLKNRGIDTQIDYNHTFDWGQVNLSAYWTHVLEDSSFTNPSDPTFADVFKNELNSPTDAVTLYASFKRGKVTFGYNLRWLDKMYLNTNEDYNTVNGLPPQNTDYAPVNKYNDVFYHDFRLGVDVSENFNFYAGVENAFNRMPPLGLTGVGAGSGVYDNKGRYFFAGFKASM